MSIGIKGEGTSEYKKVVKNPHFTVVGGMQEPVFYNLISERVDDSLLYRFLVVPSHPKFQSLRE